MFNPWLLAALVFGIVGIAEEYQTNEKPEPKKIKKIKQEVISAVKKPAEKPVAKPVIETPTDG